ncbi:DUF892 family protein [Orrella sp. JC864]|uniref:DUF892 family protein n=1 Tax=Orrella sp. JC864 TaxID=3120298 RepID=UPI0012BCA980
MEYDTFKRMYLAELQEMRSAEDQLADALPRLAEKASASDLRQAVNRHALQTERQRERLDALIQGHRAEPAAHRDSAMGTLLKEAGRWADKIDVPALRDAGLISSLQRIEHYEIAVYGSLATWAKQLGLDGDMTALLDILEEEKRTDHDLSVLAKKAVNPQAARS